MAGALHAHISSTIAIGHVWGRCLAKAGFRKSKLIARGLHAPRRDDAVYRIAAARGS
jgi:hypothetical protein